MTQTLLILGATGQQGGATINALLADKRGREIKALVRDPASKSAQGLGRRGVTLVKGDLDDAASVERAMQGVYGVYSVQTPLEGGPEREEKQGKMVADAASKAGVKHFVYSSVAGSDRHSGVPHFESKGRVEQHIAQLGLPATILRPVLFMDNFNTFQFRTIMLAMFRTYVAEDSKVQMVATADIGRLAAEAFNDPDRYIGQAIELAGDAVTRKELVLAMRKAGLRPAISLKVPSFLQGKVPAEYKIMMRWIANSGFQADIPALRSRHRDLITVAQWARRVAA